MSFSERIGLKQKPEAIQLKSMDSALRSGLWDAMHLGVFEKFDNRFGSSLAESNMKWLFRSIWHLYFKHPIDTLPYAYGECVKIVRSNFFKIEWNECYDFVEFIANHCDKLWRDEFVSFANTVLERNLSGYRFIGLSLTPISNEEEIKSIASATANKTINSGARAHLEAALRLMSDRKNPDYRNSIKESISAVESVCQQLTGNPKATLGDALKILEKQGRVHAALKASFNSLYGYTSDANGIRHAMLEEATLEVADSQYMLIACSSFVNYLTSKAGR